MIEPVRHGEALLAEIDGTHSAPGTIAVWWLGQSGYLIKSRFGTLVIDPYLSEYLTRKNEGTAKPHVRMTHAPLRGSDLGGVDLVLSSHKHPDHLDPETMPEGLGLPRGRMIGLDSGRSFAWKGFAVRAFPSAHEGLDTDERGRHLDLGFVV